jgi:putative transposase
MSRTVNGEFLFGDVEKEMLRKHIWLVADYCGVQVVTAAAMSNHFHITVRVAAPGAVSDAELLRRYALLHNGTSRWQRLRLEALQRILAENPEEAGESRSRQLAMMHDISPYMQLLNQRFSKAAKHSLPSSWLSFVA